MSDSEFTQFNQWRDALLSALSVVGAERAARFPDLPVFTLEGMNPSMRSKIEGYYHTRAWEHCDNKTCSRSVNGSRLKKCAACGTVPGLQVLYCSRRCQSLDWPVHKHRCREYAIGLLQAGTLLSSLLEVDASIIPNCTRLAPKRTEGLKLILVWLFDTIYRANPGINLWDTCLTIHCRSSRFGKGVIIPVAYQLEEMSNTTFGLPPPHVRDWDQGTEKIGTVQVCIDTVYMDRVFFNITTVEFFDELSGQWPWIFATIASMRNYNADLWMYRLQQLYFVVKIYAGLKFSKVLHFQAPKNLRNGERWELYDFDEWLEIFGNVINF